MISPHPYAGNITIDLNYCHFVLFYTTPKLSTKIRLRTATGSKGPPKFHKSGAATEKALLLVSINLAPPPPYMRAPSARPPWWVSVLGQDDSVGGGPVSTQIPTI